MAYTATYGADEVSEVGIDILVGVGAALFSFVTIFGLIFAYKWARKNAK